LNHWIRKQNWFISTFHFIVSRHFERISYIFRIGIYLARTYHESRSYDVVWELRPEVNFEFFIMFSYHRCLDAGLYLLILLLKI
jgi:hypothetical protein